MQFISKTSKAHLVDKIIPELTSDLQGEFDLAILFVTPKKQDEVKGIVEQLNAKLKIKNFFGCTAAGIIGNDEEIEDFAGASLLLARLPEVKIYPYFIDDGQLEGLQNNNDWYEFFDVYPNENPVFLTLPDPFNFDMERYLKGMNAAYPNCSIFGGLASGTASPNGNTMILNNQYFTQGVIGCALVGNIKVDTVVSQGCRPVGETFIVTKVQDNVVYELAGRPFLEVAKKVFEKASDRDKRLAQQMLFLGIAMDEYKQDLKRGDFLIRGVMGIDQATGAGIVADHVKQGRTVQFHLRDAQTATEDLIEMLACYRKQFPNQQPAGALLFSCNGRGQHLFNELNHDIRIIQNHLGPVQAAGFFCAGEIGPISGKNYLHGFTDSIALFYPQKVGDSP